jgi:hypothetical protein
LQHSVECRQLGARAHAFAVDCGYRDEVYNCVEQVGAHAVPGLRARSTGVQNEGALDVGLIEIR